VHGKTSGFTESKELKQLRMEVETAYSRFLSDPFYIIHSRRNLFSRPIESVTALDRISIRCWCKSVKEAELTSQKRKELLSKHQRSTLHHYFKKADSKATSRNRGQPSPLFHPPFSVEYYKRNDSRSSKKSLGHGHSTSAKAVNKDSIKFWCTSLKKADLTSQWHEELLSKHQRCALHHNFSDLIRNDTGNLRDPLESGHSIQNPMRA